mmetsp:Transcript_3568/g.8513  ORF Transcript_3568/g.8513 Transcript_3568/m.8513 type:complete len:208 (+) Transcript_3568:1144-1767(+)
MPPSSMGTRASLRPRRRLAATGRTPSSCTCRIRQMPSSRSSHGSRRSLSSSASPPTTQAPPTLRWTAMPTPWSGRSVASGARRRTCRCSPCAPGRPRQRCTRGRRGSSGRTTSLSKRTTSPPPSGGALRPAGRRTASGGRRSPSTRCPTAGSSPSPLRPGISSAMTSCSGSGPSTRWMSPCMRPQGPSSRSPRGGCRQRVLCRSCGT